LQLCFQAGDEQYRLLITRRSSRLLADQEAAADVCCERVTFGALLLGNLNVTRARESGRLAVRDDDALHRLVALFPPSLFWLSRFDALRA
jgi:hypothetical protein